MIYIRYIFKMLTLPLGTTFEINRRRVNRFTYIYKTLQLLK